MVINHGDDSRLDLSLSLSLSLFKQTYIYIYLSVSLPHASPFSPSTSDGRSAIAPEPLLSPADDGGDRRSRGSNRSP